MIRGLLCSKILKIRWSLIACVLLMCVALPVSADNRAINAQDKAILKQAGIDFDSDDYEYEVWLDGEGRVTSLNLEGHGLTQLPLVLLTLPQVETINLDNNAIAGDIGKLTQAFMQTHPVIGQQLNSLNFADNKLSGDIGPLVELLSQQPGMSIIADGNAISEISVMPQSDEVYVSLDNQHLDLLLEFNPSKLSPRDFMAQLPSAVRYDKWFCIVNDYVEVHLMDAEDNGVITIYSDEGGFDVWTCDRFFFHNGDVFQAVAGNTFGLRVKVLFEKGDVNYNGTVDEDDVNAAIECVNHDNQTWGNNYTAADMNEDGQVDLRDVLLLKHLLSGTTTPTTISKGDNVLITEKTRIKEGTHDLPFIIDNADDIMALQFDLLLPADLYIHWLETEAFDRLDDHFDCSLEVIDDNGETFVSRITLYSINDEPVLKAGSGPVLALRMSRWNYLPNFQPQVRNAVFATVDAKNVFTKAQLGVLDFSDLPQLEVKASKSIITEGETFTLTVSTDHANIQPLPITLQSENDSRFDFPSQTQIPAGQQEVTVVVKTIDDDLPSLDLSNLFTASAPDHDNGEVLVLLKDDDVPELELVLSPGEVNELDGDGAVTATLRRTKKTDNKITVEISDDANGALTYNHSMIEMAKDVSEVSFHLGPVDNEQADGDKTFHVTAAIYVASCDCAVGGESAGSVTATLKVLDDDGPNGHKPTRKLADAIVSSLIADKGEVEVGGDVTFNITVKNQGTDVLPQTLIKLYSDLSGHVATLRTNDDLAEGASETLQRKLFLTHVGNDRFWAVVNEDEEVPELRYANNESQALAVKVLSPYTATVATDKQNYMQTEKVKITGQLEGRNISNASVDVYIINNGSRQVETVLTNAQGAFSYEFAPMEYQTGHFVVGACYPGEEAYTEMAAFNVYGLRRSDYSYISSEITVGDTHKGNILLQNPGVLDLSVVQATVLSKPDNVEVNIDVPSYIKADGEVALKYELKAISPSPRKQWEEVKLLISSAEGASLPITLYYYAQLAGAQLKALDGNLPLTEVYTTMQKDAPRDYPLIVTNLGRGHTGKITLALPKCITSPMGQTLSGIAPGDTAVVMLRFVPVEGMQLNVPYTGMFSVNVENGEGFSMNFSVTPTSDEQGTMLIDVTDELTYYTAEAPHVEGAEVVVRNPVTEALVAQGKTDAKGHYSVTLPEGYYQVSVSADKHNSVQKYVVVDPGVTTEKEFCLTYEAVTITWTVEETEVEDEYRVVTTYDFETRVPVPVVQMNTVPERIGFDHLAPGESLIYHTVLTNKGLITANGTTLQLPQNDEFFTWEPLAQYENISLEPQQSIIIPVKVTRVANSAAARVNGPKRVGQGGGMPCTLYQSFTFYWMCGLEEHFGYGGLTLYFRACPGEGGGAYGAAGCPTGFAPGGESGEGGGGGISLVDFDCYKFVKKLWDIADCISSFLPVSLGDVEGGVKCAMARYRQIKNMIENPTLPTFVPVIVPWGDLAPCYQTAAGHIPGVDKLMLVNTCLKAFGMGGNSGAGGSTPYSVRGKRTPRKAEIEPSYSDYFREICALRAKELEALRGIGMEIFGDSVWLRNTTGEELNALMVAVTPAGEVRTFTLAELKPYQPGTISDAQFERFVERINNTITYDLTGQTADNMISTERLIAYTETINDVEFEATRRNYESTDEMFRKEYEIFMGHLQEQGGGSVCATIKLQISQTMTLTRQAFRGTLTIENGSESLQMKDIKLRLKVMSSQGVMATAKEFEMHVESLEGFMGDPDFDSGWTLETGEKGTANILFTPTKYAAPVRPVDYSFGGTLSYTEPISGAQVTRELFPVTLTVKPTPELDLTYFMQRDIFGDDPLTEDVVEPMVPAEFAVLINNKGYGEASNVRMVTEQPKIIENEKGLFIDFEILSSQLNGQDRIMAMGQNVATEFGTIPARKQSWAQWELQSTLMGHFVTYNIEATHVSSYGNPDLSLLGEVSIHELIHGFTRPAMADQRGWLVNDELDSDDMPDKIYFSDATTCDVKRAAIATIEEQEDNTHYLLSVTPGKEGWTYGSLEDPTEGHQRLLSVVRQRDKMVMPADNFWTTDRTLRDAREPVYENRLHFIADMKAEGETYLLVFEPRPDVILQVEEFPGQPDPELVMTEQVKELKVRFNKPIDEQTFTTDDITFICQGKPLPLGQVTITKLNDTDFLLDLSAVTLADGYYVLTVQTAGISDTEGYKGETGKQTTWI